MSPSHTLTKEAGAPPLTIVSAGRSGSTLLHGLLARHERCAWLSRASETAPTDPGKQRRILLAARQPGLGPLVRRRWPPDEAYGFWDHHFPGFGRPFRDLVAADLTTPVQTTLRRYFGGLLSAGRPTLLLKVTGWPRADFLAELLPGTRFVHIVRDGREVARSLLTMPWWQGWRGPAGWRFGPLTDEEEAEWVRSNRSFAVLAGIQWRRLLHAAEQSAVAMRPDRWLDVRYEDLCADPELVLTRVLDFAGLPPSPTIASALERGTVRAPRSRWEADLSDHDAGALEKAVRKPLSDWGYP